MNKKDTFVVRSGRTGSFLTLPNGRRVHTLDRETFERAIDAANTYITGRGSDRRRLGRYDEPVRRREPI